MFMREAIFKLRQMWLYTKIMASSASGDFSCRRCVAILNGLGVESMETDLLHTEYFNLFCCHMFGQQSYGSASNR